jgi:hypothetical protein
MSSTGLLCNLPNERHTALRAFSSNRIKEPKVEEPIKQLHGRTEKGQ